jgi:hypothetical protein
MCIWFKLDDITAQVLTKLPFLHVYINIQYAHDIQGMTELLLPEASRIKIRIFP